jgi:DNA repair protein RecO (recombination protein O)
MTTPRTYSTAAVVLRQSDLGEADRIVTLYTPFYGKVRAVAKGARRPTSHLGGHLELLTHCRVFVARGRELDIVTQAETIEPFLGLRDDLWRATLACYCIELLDRLTADHTAEPATFELLVATLTRVANDRNPELALHFYQMQLFCQLGYNPQLRQCTHCSKPLEPEGNFFSVTHGGVLCPDCRSTDPAAKPLGGNAFRVLRVFESGDYALAARVRLSEALRHEIDVVLREYGEQIIEREVRSGRLLAMLRGNGRTAV